MPNKSAAFDLLPLFLLIVTLSSAQIKGKIIDGITKKPCCDFTSIYDKISVFTEGVSEFEIGSQPSFSMCNDIESESHYHHLTQVNVNKGPPDKGVPLIHLYCVLRI